SSLMQTITVVDTTAPEFTNVPSGNEFECDETVEYGEATAADNCGDVTITFADMTEAGQCANEYTIVRTWTATDACGNAAEAQSFYYIYDTTAPSFDGSVEDVNVECADEVPAMPELTATDNCSEATVSMSSEVLEQDECGNGVTVVTYIATDACGNTAELSYTITVNDVTAPALSDTPEDLVIDCEAEVPAPAEISALDNCSEVEVIFTEEILGNAPAEGSIADCVGYTGESPFYETDWSLWLQAFPGDDDYYTTTNVNFVEYPDGTATISGSVISTSTAGGWTIDVTLENGMDWESWSSQDFPASYKDDFGVAGENYLDWTYYIVSAGNATLTGTGIYEGDVLELSHAPANFYYAFQVGVGANNTTANYGGGGWFYYDGTVGGMDVSGAGDFAFDLDCCPQYEILRTWTATDCSGNAVSHSQIISFADLGEEAVAEEGAGDNWSNVAVERENKAQHAIFPNPTNAKSMIQFVNDADGHTVIEVYSLNGTKVADVFNQETAAGHNYRADIDAQDLADGIYLVRIQHNGQVTTDRLIISK
ncbi:MAG: T9SS type A sorting domain-containing protein, partial [Flavobacteriales bacterium]